MDFASVPFRWYLYWYPEADFTPLIFASYHGNTSLVRTLLEMGADINAVDRNGWTALHWAAQQNRVDVTCILLRNGANRRAKDCHGHMPYQVTSHPDMADALRPDAFYPQIQSNGAVSTDEEDNSETDTSSDEESTINNNNNNAATAPGRRKPGAVPTYHYLRRLNYNHRNNHRINGNLFHSPLKPIPQASKPQPTARLARDDEDMRVGPAKA